MLDLEIRKSGLGGSDIAAILGYIAQRKPIDVCLDKWGEAPLRDQNDPASVDRLEVGHDLEPVMARWFERVHAGGSALVPLPTLRHVDRSWQIGTPDRAIYEPGLARGPARSVIIAGKFDAAAPWRAFGAGLDDRQIPKLDDGLEIKTHGSWYAQNYDFSTGEPPNSIRVQADWYMSLLGVDSWHLAVLADTHRRHHLVVHRDRELEAYLLEEAEAFWTNHICEGVLPDPDGSESFARYLKRRYKKHSADILPAGPEVGDLAQQYVAASEELKAWKHNKETLSQQLKQQIGDVAGLEGDWGRVTNKERRTGKIDYKALLAVLVERYGIADDEIEDLKRRFEGDTTRALHVKLND